MGPLNVNVHCKALRFSTLIWQRFIIFFKEASFTRLVFHKTHFGKVCLVNWLFPTETLFLFLYLHVNLSNIFLQFPTQPISTFYDFPSFFILFLPSEFQIAEPCWKKLRVGNWLNLQRCCYTLLSFQNRSSFISFSVNPLQTPQQCFSYAYLCSHLQLTLMPLLLAENLIAYFMEKIRVIQCKLSFHPLLFMKIITILSYFKEKFVFYFRYFPNLNQAIFFSSLFRLRSI